MLEALEELAKNTGKILRRGKAPERAAALPRVSRRTALDDRRGEIDEEGVRG